AGRGWRRHGAGRRRGAEPAARRVHPRRIRADVHPELDATSSERGAMTEYQRLRPSFILLHVSLGLLLGIGGATTAWAAYRAAGPHAAHLVALGGVEAVSALLFLLPRTLRLGAAGLVLGGAVALVVHLSMGQWREDLVLYIVAVLFVAAHGA